MDFFCFKDLFSGENQRGDQDSFLVPLKKPDHLWKLKFRSTEQFTYHYSWAYPGIVETPPLIYISRARCPFIRTEEQRVRRSENWAQRREKKNRDQRREEEGKETERLKSEIKNSSELRVVSELRAKSRLVQN